MQSSLEGRRRAWIFNSGARMHSVLHSVAKCSIYCYYIYYILYTIYIYYILYIIYYILLYTIIYMIYYYLYLVCCNLF